MLNKVMLNILNDAIKEAECEAQMKINLKANETLPEQRAENV